MRLSHAVYFEGRPPSSSIQAPARERAAQWFGARHVMELLAVLDGSYTVGVVGEPLVRLEAGEIVLLPRGDAYVFRSTPRGRDAASRESTHDSDLRIVSALWGWDARALHPLVMALPRMLRHTRPALGSDPLFGMMRSAVRESRGGGLGASRMLTTLSELMFLEVVRPYVEEQPSVPREWLAGLRDPLVARALTLLHERPSESWGLDTLARACGVSRSVLAARFTRHVGLPPMQYLTRRRIEISARALERSSCTIGSIASEVGYESEAAFQRMFKKVMGESPGSYRQRARTAGLRGSVPRDRDRTADEG